MSDDRHPATTPTAAPLRRRVLIIVNPAAGRARSSRRRLDRVVAALRRCGCLVTLRQAGPQAGDVEHLARVAAPDFDVIVAAGGDGTLNAVVNGVAAAPRPIALMPLGTANVVAQEIGLPRAPERLAAMIAGGPARPIWPGKVGQRLFVQMASSGFDAEIVAAVNPRLKRRFGRLAVAWGILLCLWRYRPRRLAVLIDGVEHRAAAVIAAKGRFYAGPYTIAPRASLAEPILDLVLFQCSGRLAVLRYLGALIAGRLPARPDITTVRCREALVCGPEAAPVQADGEVVAALPVTIGIADRPLPLVHP